MPDPEVADKPPFGMGDEGELLKQAPMAEFV